MNIINKLFGCKEQEEQKSGINLTDLYVLRTSNYPCEKCNIDGKSCRKLHFADSTICVCDKSDVVTFRNKVKRQSKK